MKCLLALTCAAFIAAPIANVFASDIPLPQRKPLLVNASAVDPVTLSEAKILLEQISLELKKPVQPQPQAMASIEPAAGTANITTPETTEELLVSRSGDIEMSCGALSTEALHMRDVIYATQDVKDRARMQSHGITAAGAIGSFLVGTVTGGVGLAVGGFLLDQNVGGIEEDADNIQDTAAQRRTLMMGIYNAKGCEGPLEHAMQNPEIFSPLEKIASIETASGTLDTSGYND